MSYECKSIDGDKMVIRQSSDFGSAIFIDACGAVPYADAPRIALEILKAAGYEPRMTDHLTVAVHHLSAYVEELEAAKAAAEAEAAAAKEAEARQKRRDELADEIYTAAYGEHVSWGGYKDVPEVVQVAIDRIIDMEAGAKWPP